ncbi:hypothetical protein PUN28_016480 [Cardiocondyla obscurior]|uniref:Uncharacterized protein n=1 Tax=Cardiocondyla obscurior TaxID=286306 RepID=A0AAW2EMA7_9HYME
MIVVVETNAARTVKFAKQMPLVDASAGLLSAAVTTFLFRVKELAGAWLSRMRVCGCAVMAIMMMVIEALWVFRKTDGEVHVKTYGAWLSGLDVGCPACCQVKAIARYLARLQSQAVIAKCH